MHNNNQPYDKILVVFGGSSYHNFKKVEEQGSLVDAHPKKRKKKNFLYYAVASVTPIKGRAGLPALRALCEEDED